MPSSTAGFDQFLEDIAPFFYRRSLSYVDVGGFVGEMLEKLLASKLKVREAHLIEPNPDSLQQAQKRLAPLFKGQSLNFHALAMGDQEGHVRMSAARSMSKVLADSSGGAQGTADGSFDVECSTLDRLSARFTDGRVSLLKIDVEGYEEHVIAGARELLQQQRVDVIYIEAGMNPQGTQQVYYRRIEDLLVASGYRLFKIYEQHHEWMVDSPLLRRVNLAFMSTSFAENNPYRLTLELNKISDELDQAGRSMQAQREHSAKQAERIVSLEQDAEQWRARLSELQSALEQQRAASSEAATKAAVQLDQAEKQRSEAKRATTALLTGLEQRLVAERQKASSELQALQSQLEQVSREANAHEQALALTRNEGRSVKAELAASRQALAASKADLATEQRRINDALAAHAALQTELARERVDASRLKQNLGSVNQRLADQEQRRHATENSLREVFASLAEVQRRALGTQTKADDAESDLARIRRRRAYRLARVAAAQRGSLMGWLGMPMALWREYRAPKPASLGATARKQARELANALTFRADRSSLSLPLSIKSQAVLLPKLSSLGELWAQAVMPNPELAVTMDLRWRPADAGMEVGPLPLETGDASPHMLPAGESIQLRLQGVDAFKLLSLPAEHPPILLELRRLRGDMPVIKLEFRKPRPQSPRPRAATTADVALTTSDSPVESPALATVEEPAVERYDSAELEKKLWAGYAEFALPSLEERKLRPDVSLKEREDAAWSLIRWYLVHDDPARALENARFTRDLVAKPHRRVALAQAQCLVKLDRLEEADAVLAGALGTWPDNKRDFQLYRSTVQRRIDIGLGMALPEVEARQLEAINDVFRRVGLAALEKRDPSLPLDLSNIVARAEAKQTDQQRMVSIIVPAYNAAGSIDAVIDGLLRQTWRNLEIIVVDDCSSDDTCARVERLAAADERVRLIRKSINEGAYPTRNAGARVARGHFITVHDSDDWSHPQKLETQITYLDERPGAQAVTSHWVRVGDGLEITGPWVARGSLVDVNFSSLLFERSLLDTLGYWDEVKISGDAEFVFRMTAMFGSDAIVRVPERLLLSLSLIREDSLTRAKATHLRSLYYGLRWNYRDSYLHWCGKLKAGSDPLPTDPESGRRRFPAPIGIRPGRVELQKFDLIVVADFAEPGEPLERALSFISAAGQSGRRVGAWHWRPYERPSRVPLMGAFYDACLSANAGILSPGDLIEVQAVIVSDAALLHRRITPAPTIKAAEVLALVDDVAQRGVRLDAELASTNSLELFGARVTWVAASPMARDAMVRAGGFGPQTPPVWFPLMAMSEPTPSIRAAEDPRAKAVLGRFGSDDPADWPLDAASIRQVYPAGDDHAVRILGGVAPVRRLLGELPEGWQVVSASISHTEFLGGIDFYIHHATAADPLRGQRAALAAMAAGRVVIASPACQPLFGASAVYAEPAQVAESIAHFRSSSVRYTSQVEVALDFVRRHADINGFGNRLAQVATATADSSVLPGVQRVSTPATASEHSQPA